MFAQKKVTLSAGRHKIIILDEADRLVFPFFFGVLGLLIFPSFNDFIPLLSLQVHSIVYRFSSHTIVCVQLVERLHCFIEKLA